MLGSIASSFGFDLGEMQSSDAINPLLYPDLMDDNAFVFCSFLEMNMISKASVSGWTAHACDYYEVTADLDIS